MYLLLGKGGNRSANNDCGNERTSICVSMIWHGHDLAHHIMTDHQQSIITSIGCGWSCRKLFSVLNITLVGVSLRTIDGSFHSWSDKVKWKSLWLQSRSYADSASLLEARRGMLRVHIDVKRWYTCMSNWTIRIREPCRMSPESTAQEFAGVSIIKIWKLPRSWNQLDFPCVPWLLLTVPIPVVGAAATRYPPYALAQKRWLEIMKWIRKRWDLKNSSAHIYHNLPLPVPVLLPLWIHFWWLRFSREYKSLHNQALTQSTPFSSGALRAVRKGTQARNTHTVRE